MDLSWLHIWLVVCMLHHVLSRTEVKRGKEFDTFESKKCMKCVKHGASCTSKTSCCKKCKCDNTKRTFYRKGATQSCVTDDEIANDDGCKFFIHATSHGSHDTRITWIKLKDKATVKLGFFLHTMRLFYPKGYNCRVLKVQYWNLVKWVAFKDADFSMGVESNNYVLKLSTSDKSKYEGFLVKLEARCDSKSGKYSKLQGCTVFKLLGENDYAAETGEKVPTQPPITTAAAITITTTLTTQAATVKRSMLIIIIIAAGATLALVIAGIVIWCCCWRKRKSRENRDGKRLLSRGEDPNYQNPDYLPGRQSSELNGSANNLTYLQPVDAMPSRYKGNHLPGRPKDPKYDYPDVHLQNMPNNPNYRRPHGDSIEKPIYAEVDDFRKPDPDYTKPDLIIKPRSGTEVVGVPGYQPPSGPTSDSGESSHDQYSSLGVVPGEDSLAYQSLGMEQAAKPPTPQYAEVVPDDGGGKSPVLEENTEVVI